jgi:flagellar biosynthesis GTPase FlhF
MGAVGDLINFFLVSTLIFFGAWYVTNHTSLGTDNQQDANSEQDASSSKARSKKKNSKKKKSKPESTAPEAAPAAAAAKPAAKPAAARGVDALEQLRAERRAEMAAAMPEYTRELEERAAAEEAERQVLFVCVCSVLNIAMPHTDSALENMHDFLLLLSLQLALTRMLHTYIQFLIQQSALCSYH